MKNINLYINIFIYISVYVTVVKRAWKNLTPMVDFPSIYLCCRRQQKTLIAFWSVFALPIQTKQHLYVGATGCGQTNGAKVAQWDRHKTFTLTVQITRQLDTVIVSATVTVCNIHGYFLLKNRAKTVRHNFPLNSPSAIQNHCEGKTGHRSRKCNRWKAISAGNRILKITRNKNGSLK